MLTVLNTKKINTLANLDYKWKVLEILVCAWTVEVEFMPIVNNVLSPTACGH